MPELRAVSNAGPLIYLSVLNRFDLLKRFFGELYVPRAVYDEVVVEGEGLPGCDETRSAVEEGWMQVASVQDGAAVEALLDRLHPGEAETIVLARTLGLQWALLDERIARDKARLMGVNVTGTIGILIRAMRDGIDLDLRSDLDVLIDHNFRISRDLYDRLVGK